MRISELRSAIRIEPLLYDTVYIHDFRGIHSKQDFLESLKRNGRHVRRLLVHDVPNTQLIARYLSCCPNVNDLALWAVIYDDTCLALINALPLKRLSCDLCDFIGSQEGFTKRVCDGHPILTKLTHLDLVGVRITWTWVGLSFLPNLTHLFVPGAIRDVAIRSILDHCQSLRVLIVARNNRNSIPEQSDDLRVVRRNIDDYSQDWEAGARGGRDTYMVAEEEVAERLKKRNTAVVD